MSEVLSSKIRPVILAGGAGTRLWPLSTAAAPKHLLPLLGEETLFDETIARLADASLFSAPIVVANIRQEAALREVLADVPGARILLEPVKRDSGPAIALAALAADADELLLICPSDQHIADVAAFRAAIVSAIPAATAGAIVTFGIEPDHPATGFGYIEAGEGSDAARPVARFVEKPPLDKAEAMLAAGGHYWNAGLFLATAATWRAEFEIHAPDMLAAARDALNEAEIDGPVTRVGEAAFARAPARSIDYAVMEKAANVRVVAVAMGWSDVGSWQSVHDAAVKDAGDNAVGHGNISIDSRGTLIRSSGPRVAAIGVEDLIIIATPDAVLVIPRGDAQRVREAAAWFEQQENDQ